MKKRLITTIVTLCLTVAMVIPVGAVEFEKSASVCKDAVRMINDSPQDKLIIMGLLGNHEIVNLFNREAKSEGLFSIDTLVKYEDDIAYFEKMELIDSYSENGNTVEIYQSDVAAICGVSALSNSQSDTAIDTSATVRIYTTIYYQFTTDL